jgi:ribonuclease HII
MTIGIDEVGRGCWAGPLLVVAARQTSPLAKNIADSKALSRKTRQRLFYDIQLSCDLGEGWVHAAEINEIGLAGALKLGVSRALADLKAGIEEEIIMDGNYNYCPKEFKNARCRIKADFELPIVSAASIYAKVLRDNYMEEAGKRYPVYRFEKHVGYGTKLHLEMLRLHGVCELHRTNYKPVRELADV